MKLWIANCRARFYVWVRAMRPPGGRRHCAQARLTYGKGLGRPADLVKAAEWHKKAAEQNFAPAQTALAMLYERGNIGGKADAMAALALYRRTAQLNEALAALFFVLIVVNNLATHHCSKRQYYRAFQSICLATALFMRRFSTPSYLHLCAAHPVFETYFAKNAMNKNTFNYCS